MTQAGAQFVNLETPPPRALLPDESKFADRPQFFQRYF